jgi:hypothetical protein
MTTSQDAWVDWSLHIAKFLAPIVIGSTAALTIYEVFSSRVLLRVVHIGSGRRILSALRFRLGEGHVLICGVGGTGLHLIREFRDRGNWVVAIEKNPDNEFVS